MSSGKIHEKEVQHICYTNWLSYTPKRSSTFSMPHNNYTNIYKI